MKRLVITATVLVGIAGYVAARTEPAWFQKTGLDVWNLGSLRDEHKAADAKYEDLVGESERIQQRIARCEHVAARLCDGHISLTEGSAEVERICQTDPVWFEAVRCIYHDDTRLILAARYLIRKTEGMLLAAKEHHDTSRVLQLSARLNELKAELQSISSTAASELATNRPVTIASQANTDLVDAVTPSALTLP
jgi:hypothetical protein